MPSIQLLPSGSFRALARHKGKTETSTFPRREDAKRWAEAVERKMRDGAWERPAASPVAIRTVARAYEEYISSAYYASLAENTKRAAKHLHKPLLKFFGDKLLRDVSERDVRDYIELRLKTPSKRHKDKTLSGDAVRLEVAALSGCFKWHLERKNVERNPCLGVSRPKTTRRTGRLSDELVGAILNHPKARGISREGLFFRLLFATAARPGELAAARKSWYRPNPPQIVIPRTKNEDERTILIPDSLADFFDYYVKMDDTGSDFIFSSRSRAKNAEGDYNWVPFNYASHWKVIVKDLGVQGLVVPHMARHEAISRLFERTNLTEGAIAAISGHRSAQALWRYKHFRSEHSRPAVNALHDVYSQASLGKPVDMLPGEQFKLAPPKKISRSKRGTDLGVFPKSGETRNLNPLPQISSTDHQKTPRIKAKG